MRETRAEVGLRLFRHARDSVHEIANRCLAGSHTDVDAVDLAEAINEQLAAVNRLEDTPHFESAHRQLDYAGRVQRVFFPDRCMLANDGTNYSQKCPVAVGHLRLGVSIGTIVEQAECSICGLDPEDCVHISGRMYEGEECYRIIKKMGLDHVAIVERPDFPDSRLSERPVSTQDLSRVLGPEFTPGMELRCNRCLDKCRGLERPDMFSKDEGGTTSDSNDHLEVAP